MSRLFGQFGVCLVVLAANICGAALAQDAGLTRIETRPFYGATVTIEEGVRVFRPLPPTSHMIINPSRSPLNLSINYERRAAQEDGANIGNNGYANATTTYTNATNGQATNDQSFSSYGSYGNYDNGPANTATYGAKGKGLRGFGSHGVRVNGQLAAGDRSAQKYPRQQYSNQQYSGPQYSGPQYSGPQYGRTGSQGYRQGFGKAAQQPISRYHAPHGFSYSGNNFNATRPMHLPPIGYGAARSGYIPRGYALHRPMMPPQIKPHVPMVRPAAPMQAYRVIQAPAPIQAAPMHPAHQMGMGMGQAGHAGRAMGGIGRGR
jgi:hypothetical protein